MTDKILRRHRHHDPTPVPQSHPRTFRTPEDVRRRHSTLSDSDSADSAGVQGYYLHGGDTFLDVDGAVRVDPRASLTQGHHRFSPRRASRTFFARAPRRRDDRLR